MNKLLFILSLVFFFSCKTSNSVPLNVKTTVIAFGSCNDEEKEQPMWKYIIENEPDFAYPIEFSSCDTPEKILKTIVELGDKSWVTAEHLVGLTLQASEHHGINFR